jgi:hypothetical protein
MRKLVKIAVVLGLAAGALYVVAQMPPAQELTDAEWRCKNIADKAAPVGIADKDTYMNAYRACLGRQR